LLKIDAWTMKNERFRRGQTLGFAVVSALLSAHLGAQELSTFVTGQLPSLVSTYKTIHSHPELSHHEEHTSALLAAELRKAGYAVTERVGKYPDGSQAYGVVAVLQNGPGPRVLIRADMDALPVVEETGVPYASHVKSTNASGQEVGVMHACGHDIHVTTLIGTARALAASKSKWHGTLMLIGQPSEEMIDGARAMLADHLYERFGKPDLVIGLHDTNTRGRNGCDRQWTCHGCLNIDRCGVAGHWRTWGQAAGRQGSHRHGRSIHRSAADHCQPPGEPDGSGSRHGW
jgi:metal-dependent amidase/aminoacylase/carboxypeptidase family protein